MTVSKRVVWLAVAALALTAAPVQTVEAQVRYGAWRNTGECRNARTTSGFGGTELPSASGQRAQQCRWERTVESCPRVRDKLRHPIRCSTRRQTQWSIGQPRS